MNFDSLLRSSAENQSAPSDFIAKLQRTIDAQIAKRQRTKLIRDGMLLGTSLIIFFLAGSEFLTALIELQTSDFVSAIILQPSILFIEEGRSAILETLPFLSFIAALLALILSVPLVRMFIKDSPSISHIFSSFYAIS